MSRTLDDLNIKDNIIVFNRTYKIEMSSKVSIIEPTEENPLNEIECDGLLKNNRQLILLSSTIHQESRLFVLFHELGHIALEPHLVGDNVPAEKACDAIAAFMYDFCHNFDIKYRGEK